MVLPRDFFKKKMRLVRDEMSEREIDLWITFTREGNPDPVADDLGLGGVVWKSAGVFDVDGSSFAIVGNLDAEAVRSTRIYDDVYDYGKEGASPKLGELIARRRPKKIALNLSDDYGFADGLSQGMKRYLAKSIESAENGTKRKVRRGKNSKKVKIVSSEDLIITLRSQIISEELDLLKTSVAKCEEIFRIAEQDIIRVGRTDRQIHEMMKEEVRKSGQLDFAWNQNHCPVVVIGNNPFGHTGYSSSSNHKNILEKGNLIHFDFGVKYKGYCSDIQKVYFVGESPPSSVRRLFAATKQATLKGIERLEPGIKGYLVDKACRDSVFASGYPEYVHGTGHTIARETHEIGPMLCPRWRQRYGRSMEKVLKTGMVFTIEPSVKGDDGTCNIEQEVLLTEKGGQLLSTFEDELYEL